MQDAEAERKPGDRCDELELRDDSHKEHRVTERVARDGKVLLPEIGWVEVVGKTREQIEALLAELYSAYYDECVPRVIIRAP